MPDKMFQRMPNRWRRECRETGKHVKIHVRWHVRTYLTWYIWTCAKVSENMPDKIAGYIQLVGITVSLSFRNYVSCKSRAMPCETNVVCFGFLPSSHMIVRKACQHKFWTIMNHCTFWSWKHPLSIPLSHAHPIKKPSLSKPPWSDPRSLFAEVTPPESKIQGATSPLPRRHCSILQTETVLSLCFDFRFCRQVTFFLQIVFPWGRRNAAADMWFNMNYIALVKKCKHSAVCNDIILYYVMMCHIVTCYITLCYVLSYYQTFLHFEIDISTLWRCTPMTILAGCRKGLLRPKFSILRGWRKRTNRRALL